MKPTIIAVFLIVSRILSGQIYKDSGAGVEERVNDLLPRMSITEKLDYVGGFNSFYIRGISRLGLPQIKMSDGPVGVRNYGNTTAYPAGICLAATWDTSLIRAEGNALGRDARSRGVHILLAPGMNIYRAPMCGRNFEYFGEDPYLAGQAAVAYINGVQSQRVVCTAKHYAGNNQEWDRHGVSSNIDERTLHEIYLPAFKESVIKGRTGSVMTSYNLINGIHASQHNYLNNEILKARWHFDGFVMSDWVSTYDGLAAALGGLDLEMPSAAYMSRTNLQSYLNNGTLTQDVIDDKVRRILRIIFRFGFYDLAQTDPTIPANDPSSARVALEVARSGIVLLQNTDSILPLVSDTINTIALIGPNADRYVAGGGSSYTSPFYSITLREGVQNLNIPGLELRYTSGLTSPAEIAAGSVFYLSAGSNIRGLNASYFNNKTLTAPATASRVDTTIDFHWSGSPGITGIGSDNFSIRWTGVIRPDQTGEYEFTVAGDDGYRLWVNNLMVINNWNDQAVTVRKTKVNLSAGQEYPIKLEYYENGGLAEITLGYRLNQEDYQEAIEAASGADAAIVCVGFDNNTEGEGFDRPFKLPDGQDSLIVNVARVNPNTIVVINAGGNVDMNAWVSEVKSIIHAWYPGQEGGTALAEILFGLVNPSGKLPASFERNWQDNPTYNYYHSTNKNVSYGEGLFLGYRHYTSKNKLALFPFGHGLSYTGFEYSNFSVIPDISGDNPSFTASLSIKNTGKMKGMETVQIYVRDIQSTVQRPKMELKGFAKVELEPGESKTVNIKLDPGSFSFYSLALKTFIIEKGEFEIIAGASSTDLRLSQTININEDVILSDNNLRDIIPGIYKLYPNPTSGLLNIGIPETVQLAYVELTDLQGRTISRMNPDSHQLTYDLSGLKEGIYLIRFVEDKTVYTHKILLSGK